MIESMPEEDYEKRISDLETSKILLKDSTIEKRISSLEMEGHETLVKLNDIQKILKNIEKLMIGSIDSDTVGVITQVREARKDLVIVQGKIEIMERNYTDLSEEFKKYKWISRGIMLTIGLVIAYALDFWKFLTKTP